MVILTGYSVLHVYDLSKHQGLIVRRRAELANPASATSHSPQFDTTSPEIYATYSFSGEDAGFRTISVLARQLHIEKRVGITCSIGAARNKSTGAISGHMVASVMLIWNRC